MIYLYLMGLNGACKPTNITGGHRLEHVQSIYNPYVTGSITYFGLIICFFAPWRFPGCKVCPNFKWLVYIHLGSLVYITYIHPFEMYLHFFGFTIPIYQACSLYFLCKHHFFILFPILPLQTYWKHRANEVHVSQLLGFHPGLTWMRKPFEVSMLSVTAWEGPLFGKDWLTCHKSELICFMFKGHLQQCDIPVSDWHHWRTTCQSLHPGKLTCWPWKSPILNGFTFV